MSRILFIEARFFLCPEDLLDQELLTVPVGVERPDICTAS